MAVIFFVVCFRNPYYPAILNRRLVFSMQYMCTICYYCRRKNNFVILSIEKCENEDEILGQNSSNLGAFMGVVSVVARPYFEQHKMNILTKNGN